MGLWYSIGGNPRFIISEGELDDLKAREPIQISSGLFRSNSDFLRAIKTIEALREVALDARALARELFLDLQRAVEYIPPESIWFRERPNVREHLQQARRALGIEFAHEGEPD